MSVLDELRQYLDDSYAALSPIEQLEFDNQLALMRDMVLYGECFMTPLLGQHVDRDTVQR